MAGCRVKPGSGLQLKGRDCSDRGSEGLDRAAVEPPGNGGRGAMDQRGLRMRHRRWAVSGVLAIP